MIFLIRMILNILSDSVLEFASTPDYEFKNNMYEGVVLGVFNPNSQFVRLLYASGLFGFLFLILAFTHPVKYLTKNLHRRTQNHFILYMLLLVGCSFGVRSPVPYIYLGVFISVMSLSGQNSQLLKHKEK